MAKDDLGQPLSASDGQITSPVESGEIVEEATVYSAPEASEETPADSDWVDELEIFEANQEPSRDEDFVAVEQQDSENTNRSIDDSQFTDSYLEDDEEWLAASDQILHQDEDTVIAQQEDAVVSWDIQGLYDENGKVRAKRSLRNNPPMLVISDSLGENATFVLTKNLSGVLARHIDNTHRAYYGIRPKDELSFKEKLSDAKTGIRENMGKAIVVGGILLGLLIFGFIF